MNTKALFRLILIVIMALVLNFTTVVFVLAIPDISPIIPDIPMLFLAPSNLTANSIGETQVQLTWNDNTVNETGFRVFRREEGGTPYIHLATTGPNTSETVMYIDVSAQRGHTYFYKVHAFKTDTNSDYSNEVTATTTILACPDGLAVSKITSRSITISWSDNSRFEKGYNVEIGKEGDMTFNKYTATPNSTSYLFEDLTPGTTYWVRVEVFDEENNKSKTDKITARTPFEILQPLKAPTHLNAYVVSKNKITLSWKDNSNGETEYVVERKEKSHENYIVLVNLGANAEVCNDNTVIGDKLYMYRVKVIKDMQYEYSEPFAVTTFIPGDPTSLNGIRREDSSVRLTWENDTDYETSYRVERKIDEGTYSLLGHSGPDTLVFDDNTALPEINYCYRVCAINGELVSGYSNGCCILREDFDIVGHIDDGSSGTSNGSGSSGDTNNTSSIFDDTQSGWAETELKKASDYGLTYTGILNNYKSNITREEFCKIVIKLYEKLSGKIPVVGEDPFNDTDEPEILKAYKLKIVLGIGDNKFAPQNKITRQEICVMIIRALDAAMDEIDKSTGSSFYFTDENKIALWAKEAMKFCYKNNIMKGIGESKIAPLDNTTREQAIILIKRTYEQYMSR